MKKALIVVLVLLVGFVAGAYLLPGHYEISRSVVIAADAARIQAPLSDLRTWPEWSAWTKERDPSVEWSFTGDPGEGQLWEWTGEELGNGKMRLRKVTPDKGIQYGIAFTDPDMKGEGVVQIRPSGEGNEVTWISRGSLGKNPIYRWMGLMLEGMLGPDLETGLEGLKARVEADGTTGVDAADPPASSEDGAGASEDQSP